MDVDKETGLVLTQMAIMVQVRSMTIPRRTLEALLFPVTAEIKGDPQRRDLEKIIADQV